MQRRHRNVRRIWELCGGDQGEDRQKTVEQGPAAAGPSHPPFFYQQIDDDIQTWLSSS